MQEETYFEKYTEWDVYLRGKGKVGLKTRVITPPTKVNDAISVIAEQEGLNKADIIGVMGVLNEETS